jgi:hypothetical protein
MTQPDLKKLDLQVLVDMLSEEASRYVTLVNEGCGNKDYEKCRELVRSLQMEIKKRINTSFLQE